MKPKLIRVRWILVGVASLVLVVLYVNMWSHQMTLKIMRAGISVYWVEHGEMPATLRDLVLYARKDPGSSDAQKWMAYAYVANLRTNDPPDTPVLIASQSQRGLFFGVMLTLGGHIRWHSNRQLDELAKAPWLLVQDEFDNEAALYEFKQRVKVILPERLIRRAEGKGNGGTQRE